MDFHKFSLFPIGSKNICSIVIGWGDADARAKQCFETTKFLTSRNKHTNSKKRIITADHNPICISTNTSATQKMNPVKTVLKKKNTSRYIEGWM